MQSSPEEEEICSTRARRLDQKAKRSARREGEEIKNPKRKVIRMESEETQDHVREAQSTEYEEEEERTFVPSALTVTIKRMFRCYNQCSEKTFSCWQLSSVVLNEGDEAYTTNLCQKCFNKHLQAKGETPLSNVQHSRNRKPKNTWSK